MTYKSYPIPSHPIPSHRAKTRIVTNACINKTARRQGGSLIKGADIKITVLTIDKTQIKLCVNDSGDVIINLQKSISIKDGIKVKVVKIDKAQVKLGIEAPKDLTINREDVPKED